MQNVIRKLLTSLGYVHSRIVLTRASLSSDKACLLIRDKRTLQLTHCKLVILIKARTHTAQLISVLSRNYYQEIEYGGTDAQLNVKRQPDNSLNCSDAVTNHNPKQQQRIQTELK